MKLPGKTNEQRVAYRVSPDVEHSTLWVGLTSGPAKVRFDDISARGCGFTLSAEQAEGLVEGQELVLRMRVGAPTTPQLFIRSEVRSIREDGKSVRFGVLFREHERLYTQLDESQWRFFNRRGAFRVAPADFRGKPMRARIASTAEERGRSYVVHDISSSGLSIRLALGVEFNFPEGEPLHVSFELPGAPMAFTLWVDFVHRTIVKGVERIGFRINTATTPMAEVQTEAILRYVLERQSQLLRR